MIKRFREVLYLPQNGERPLFNRSRLVGASLGYDSCNILVSLCRSLGFEKGIYLLKRFLLRFLYVSVFSRFNYYFHLRGP